MRTSAKSSWRATILVLSCPVLVFISIAWVDRTAAEWSHTHLQRPAVLDWLTHLVDPLQPLAIIGLAAAGAAALFRGWRPDEWGRTLLSACVAILVAVEIKEQLKYLFGRTWPETFVANNPSWISNRVYGFNWLHGGAGWASFPSGHTTQIAALATVLALRRPRLRGLAIALVLLVAVGLWGCDYHFIGDIVAGAYLGLACGLGVVSIISPCPSARR